MTKISNFFILFTLILITSCQSNSEEDFYQRSTDTLEIISPPDAWKKQDPIDQINITYSSAPFERTLNVTILPNERSIEEGLFDLNIEWLKNEYQHEISVPVIADQIYSQPYIERNNTSENIIDIGYKDQNSQPQVLYQITILGSDLQFKKIQDFYLVPKS